MSGQNPELDLFKDELLAVVSECLDAGRQVVASQVSITEITIRVRRYGQLWYERGLSKPKLIGKPGQHTPDEETQFFSSEIE